MRSVTSCFNVTLYKKNLARFWPLWALYTLAWLLVLPVSLLGELTQRSAWDIGFDAASWVSDWAIQSPVTRMASGFGLAMAVAYGVLVAMAVWSYLYNHRAVNLIHALPVRREGLFLTNFLSGVTFFVLPHLIVFLVTLPAELIAGAVDVQALAVCFGCQTLLCLFFFCFATLCAFLTGHLLALPAFYAIFNGLAFGLAALLDWMMTNFLFGFNGWLSNAEAIFYLTPVAALLRGFGYTWPTVTDADGNSFLVASGNRPILQGVSLLWIYAAVGLVLAALALLLYRRRQLETAGDVVAVRWLRPVFKYSVAFCAALAGGCAVFALLNLEGSVAFLCCLLFWGVVGYFAAEMLLRKSFRVFARSWKGCVATLAVLLVFSGCMQFDLLGIEDRVPDAADVVAVDVRGLDSAPYDTASYLNLHDQTDPDLIAKTVALHQAIVDHKEELERGDSSSNYSLDESSQTVAYYFRVTYTLADGSHMERSYSCDLPLYASDLDLPGSLTYAANALLNNAAARRASYEVEEWSDAQLVSAQVTSLTDEAGQYWDATLEIPYNGTPLAVESSNQLVLPAGQNTADQLEAIRQAVLSDLEAGNLGTRYLFADSEERNANTCLADLTLTYDIQREDAGGTYTYTTDVTITLTPDATDTILALKEAGFFSTGLRLTDNNGHVVYQDPDASVPSASPAA